MFIAPKFIKTPSSGEDQEYLEPVMTVDGEIVTQASGDIVMILVTLE